MRILASSIVCALACSAVLRARPQQSSSGQGAMSMPMDQMAMMPANPLGIDHVRDGSGTSWLPDMSPMAGLMRAAGPWMVMLHGNAFVTFDKTGSDRGDDQVGSVNWIMGMAQRKAAGGQLELRTMLSLEPLTVGKCGYPDLLQSGEFCDGAALHDRQHPHDLFMEVAADYRRALNNSLAVEVYGGPSGEPALGPTAFPHRLSSMPNPIAPISHHWLDSSHISFGVVTGGVYGHSWKAEASVFNGREPDDKRYGFDLAPLDSYSGRFWFLPASSWSLQVSAGHLTAAELEADGTRADVDRMTASATYHRLVNARVWATTIAWGQNREEGHVTSAATAETAADVSPANTVFARGDVVGKTGAELAVTLPEDDTASVAKLQIGYVRWLGEGGGVKTGVGVSVGVAILPRDLAAFYGGRSAGEFAVFFTARTP